MRTYFRKQARDLRKSRGWSQSHLAEQLRANGFSAAHPSTVAKIEAGDRDVTLEELEAYGAVFGVSTDALLGRSADRSDPVFKVVRRLTQTAQMGRWQSETVEAELRQAMTELSGIDTLAWLVDEAGNAADALGAAVNALGQIGAGFASGEVSKATDAMLADLLRQEIESEDA